MTNNLQHFDLDSLSTGELTELLDAVMVKLRHRDTQDIKKNMVTKSQRLTLPEHVARHLEQQ